jgi:hypothetical protein
MVINEAACFGVPTVYNRIPGLEDLIVNGENGIVVEQDDIGAMADAATEILTNDKLRKRMGERAVEYSRRFDSVNIGKRWKYLLSALIDSSSASKDQLNKHLAYSVSDYKDLSKELYLTLNQMAQRDDAERKLLTEPQYVSTVSFIKRKIQSKSVRLRDSLKSRGLAKTNKVIAKKLHHKVKRVLQNNG